MGPFITSLITCPGVTPNSVHKHLARICAPRTTRGAQVCPLVRYFVVGEDLSPDCPYWQQLVDQRWPCDRARAASSCAKVDAKLRSAFLPVFRDERMLEQIGWRRSRFQLPSQLDRLLPFFGLRVTPSNPHERNEFGLLPLIEALQFFPHFLAREVSACVLQSVAHLVIGRVRPRIRIDLRFPGL
jgi:hypothetical protein